MNLLINGVFAQSLRYAHKIIFRISTIYRRAFFSHALILNNNPHKSTGSSMTKNRNIQIYLVVFLLSFFLITSISNPVLAHKVMIFGWVEGDSVFSEAKFSGGKKAMNAGVKVFDKGGKQLLNGKTDDKGRFSFKIPKLTHLRIVLNAGMGHSAEWSIPESELRESCGNLSSKTNEPSKPINSALSKEEIKGLIEETLDRKLRPIIKIITESQSKGPSFTEIIGGIGYVFGLMGLVIYFRNKRKKTDIKEHDN